MRILIVAPRYPWPPRRGDQMRTLQHASTLAERHEVQLLVPERPAGAPSPPSDCSVHHYKTSPAGALSGTIRALRSGRPIQSGLYRHADLTRALRELVPEADQVLFVLARLALHLDEIESTPVVLDFVDSLALNFRRRALFDSFWKRPLLRFEASRLAKSEREIAGKARCCLVVGERDRLAMSKSWTDEEKEKITVVRLPVERRDPGGGGAAAPTARRLIVTGNLGYFPTDEGLGWWLREVWPGLRREGPEIELTLAGSRPSSRLRQLARQDGVELLENPGDLAPLLESADLALAPMRAGSGVPVKVLEAWSSGVPVIASAWTAEGAEAQSGRDCIVCGEAREWVDSIVALLEDEDRRVALVEGGWAHLESLHAPEVVAADLLRV